MVGERLGHLQGEPWANCTGTSISSLTVRGPDPEIQEEPVAPCVFPVSLPVLQSAPWREGLSLNGCLLNSVPGEWQRRAQSSCDPPPTQGSPCILHHLLQSTQYLCVLSPGWPPLMLPHLPRMSNTDKNGCREDDEDRAQPAWVRASGCSRGSASGPWPGMGMYGGGGRTPRTRVQREGLRHGIWRTGQ